MWRLKAGAACSCMRPCRRRRDLGLGEADADDEVVRVGGLVAVGEVQRDVGASVACAGTISEPSARNCGRITVCGKAAKACTRLLVAEVGEVERVLLVEQLAVRHRDDERGCRRRRARAAAPGPGRRRAGARAPRSRRSPRSGPGSDVAQEGDRVGRLEADPGDAGRASPARGRPSRRRSRRRPPRGRARRGSRSRSRCRSRGRARCDRRTAEPRTGSGAGARRRSARASWPPPASGARRRPLDRILADVGLDLGLDAAAGARARPGGSSGSGWTR